MSDQNLEKWIECWLNGTLDESDSRLLQEQLRSSAEARNRFREYAELDAALREVADETRPSSPPVEPMGEHRARRSWAFVALLAIAATVMFAMTFAWFFRGNNSNEAIARVTGLSGSLTWTGNGGQIARELTVGSKLSGGTIEGMAPDSWFELEFVDGSTVMISGDSMLTFSDLGQKELRLIQGRMSASVARQPAGKPMIIHTRSAELKVIGTKFDVDAELASTALHVNQGLVRIKRTSDGHTVDVPAKHRIVAAADREMTPERIPDSVNDWISRLQRGPQSTYGQWLPAENGRRASLKAIPFVPRENQAVTLYLLGLAVERGDGSPVVVLPESRFIVRGRLAKPADVFFGIQVAHSTGEFAGKFLCHHAAPTLNEAGQFEITCQLTDFVLDPCVRDRQDELPSRPDNLIVTNAWSFTHTGGPTGLELVEVELIPPE